MRKIKYASILLLIVAILLPTDLFGQRRRRKKNAKNSPVISYVHGYVGAGYSVLMHDISLGGKTTVPGGGAGVLGIGYTMKHRKNPFIFKTGLEFMFLNSSTRIDSMQNVGQFKYIDTNHPNGIDMEYNMGFGNYVENHNRFSINIPVMFGAQFDMLYFTVGAKAMLGVVNTYSTKTRLTTSITDPELIDDLVGMPNHTLQTSKPKHSGSIDLGLDVTGSAEIGIILDDWMPRKMTKLRNRKKTKLSYRAGLFVDYGLLDINTNPKNRSLISFGGDDNPTVDAGDIHTTFQPNSILNTSAAQNSALNSLVVGAKFEVMMQVSPEPVKRKKKRPRPRPKAPKPNLPDPPYFFAVVLDYETEEYIEADLKLFKLSEPFDTVFAATTPKETGFTETRIKSDKFGIIVKKPGYIDYSDTIWQINNDTLYVELQPIQENTIIVLENLLFETAKTEVKNASSSKSIDDMYELLIENPGLKIEISGHTDDIGSARNNKKLSEGRAKSVRQIMIDRGIDPSRMAWRGAGEYEPIDTNHTEEGRAENRRVEFIITENNDANMIFTKSKTEESSKEEENNQIDGTTVE